MVRDEWDGITDIVTREPSAVLFEEPANRESRPVFGRAGTRLSDADAGRMATARASPIVFNGCFGWLHPPVGVPARETAIVLCPGLSRDALNGHRSFRLLADRLAEAGYPALRFDYPGAGDSLDADREPWASWQDSIRAACDLARAATGARRIVLCGLRLGATLAAEVATRRDDVDGLILFAPVLRGKAYVRQLLVEARLRAYPPEPPPGGLEMDELRLSAETVALINQAELRKLALPPGCKVAIFGLLPSSALTECVEAWTGQGLEVAFNEETDLSALVRPSYLNDEPEADFSAVLTWLRAAAPAQVAIETPVVTPGEAVELRFPTGVETPLRFGSGGHLFGMLCRPTDAAASDRVVVIGNTGGDPHYGFARFSVELARTLAAAGIASLRLDFAGLGDSRRPDGDADSASHIFDVDRVRDFSAAIDALEALGYRRFAVQGLCSGAYHAFHAAVREPRIGEALLLNMPLFSWRLGDSIEFVNRKITRTPTYYLANAIRREVWGRLARGELDVTGIVGSQLARIWEDGVEKLRRLAGGLGWRGRPNAAQRSVRVLSLRGTRTLFLLAEGDPGVTELERQFGAGLAKLGEVPGVTVRIEGGLDHMMTGRDMRRKAAAMVLSFINRENA